MRRPLYTLLSLVLLLTLFPFTTVVADTYVPFSDDPKAIQTVSNSVIMLNCYDKNGELYSTGSAFAAFEDGVFVTNFHVIDKNTYSVRAQMETGLIFDMSSVVAYDAEKDIMILRTDAITGLEPLPIGNSSKLERGEKVIAIGSPLGLINTLSIGLYSGTIKEGETYLQFSAPISHGSSGGALFNNSGEVVGITAATFEEGQNLNLAIPIEDVCDLWESCDNVEVSLKDYYNSWEHIVIYSPDNMFSNLNSFNNFEACYVQGFVSTIRKNSKSISTLYIVTDPTQIEGNIVDTPALSSLEDFAKALEEGSFDYDYRGLEIELSNITPPNIKLGDEILVYGVLNKPSLFLHAYEITNLSING